MRCQHHLLVTGFIACATTAPAQLALVPQGDNVWSRGMQVCDLVWQDAELAPPSAVQYDLVFDPSEIRVASVDRGAQPLSSFIAGPRNIDARIDHVAPGRTRVSAVPALSTSPILHSLVIDVLAGGGEDVTIAIENLTVIGPVGDDFPLLAATFPAAQFAIAQDIAPVTQAFPPGGIALREGSFLTITPRADKSTIGLTGRVSITAEPGMLQPVTITHTGANDVRPWNEWAAGGEVDTLSLLFTSSLMPTSNGYPLPIARFHVIGSGPATTSLTISTSELHAGAPNFQSIADSSVEVPLTILPGLTALVKLDGPSSNNWEVGQQVELVASLDVPTGSTPGLARAVFEANPDHLRIDSIELVEGVPWFAELFTTPFEEAAATGRATVVTMLDTQGQGSDTQPSSGGMVPVFRVTATILNPQSDAALSFALSDFTERSHSGLDLALQIGPPAAWILIPPPPAIFDMFSIE